MNIAGLARSSTVDFPGMLSAVLFAPGCNLDCFYCHNRTLLTDEAVLLDPEDVMAFLERRRHLLDGVVFSGGEPTLQHQLAEMMARVRHMGYKTKLDTNGTRPAVLKQLLDNRLLDYVAIDLKAPWPRYPEICGCNAALVSSIRESFAVLAEDSAVLPLGWEARVTVIPQLSPADLENMTGSISPAPHFYLQRYIKPIVYRPADRFRLDAAGYTPADLVLLAEKLRGLQPNIQVR